MKTLATIKKEFLLLTRDIGGLMLIFIMPMVLVVVMAVIQNNTFQEFQETKLEALIVDEDHGKLSDALARTFQALPNIQLISKIGGNELTADEARRLVRSGKYRTAVIIPGGASDALQKKTSDAVTTLLSNYGLSEKKASAKDLPTVELQVLFDPTIKANYRQTLASALEKMAAQLQAQWFMEEVQKSMSGTTQKAPVKMDLSDLIKVTQKDASEGENRGMPLNAVQHNVPAWSMFAMFFILFPLAGNLIKEREEGSMLRLRLIAGSSFPVICGKFIFYFFVCLLQLYLIIAVGIYAMPLFGLSRLVIGTNYAGLLLTGCAVAMAATGYGLLIAVYFKTPQQALSFGSISVVILAAISGVWVPVFIMPEFMQTISPYSPLNWGLAAFNNLFLRNSATAAVLPDVARLLGFACAALALSVLIHRSRNVS